MLLSECPWLAAHPLLGGGLVVWRCAFLQNIFLQEKQTSWETSYQIRIAREQRRTEQFIVKSASL